jgi:CARDB.
MDNAPAYTPFTGLTIDPALVKTATFHGFVGSAGPNEGNLLWNGALIASNAWQGTSSTASALIFDVLSYLGASNTAGIQATQSGGMTPFHQFLVVEYNAADLIITDIKANVGAGEFMFANEPNVISVTVKNNGTVASQATTLDVEVNGTTYTVNVPALDAGASTTVTVTDTASHTGGSSIPVNANANPDRNIPETNTSNNTLNINLTVYNNGYKGKQHTDDDEYDSIDTKQTFTGKYDVIYSSGNTAYNGAGWTEKTYNWTSSDLVIPAGATVVSARLYQSYTYNQMGVDPAWTMNFNGVTVTPGATYKDIKGFGSYNYPYGLYVVRCNQVSSNKTGNTMTITPGGW